MVSIKAKIVKISGRSVTLTVQSEGEPHAYEITLPVKEPTLIDIAAMRIGLQRYKIELKNGQIVSVSK